MRTLVLAAALLLAPSGAALAQSPLSIGLRLGGGVPFGDTASGASLSDELRYTIPLTAEVSVPLWRQLAAGPFVQYAVGALSTRAPLGSAACTDTGARCSNGHVVRAGVQLLWTFDATGPVTPWAGIGTAYEWLGYSARDPSASGTVTYRGWEWVNAQLGGDVLRRGSVRLGPYASFSLGRFERIGVSTGGGSLSGEIAEKAVHGWLQLGFRASFDL